MRVVVRSDLRLRESLHGTCTPLTENIEYGLFKFGEKKTQKANIEAAAAKISEAESELRSAEESYKSEMAGIPDKVSAMESQIRSAVEKEMPLPKEPAKPVF